MFKALPTYDHARDETVLKMLRCSIAWRQLVQ